MTNERNRVLVVEDDEATRVLICEALTDEGYTTRSARDGREALSILAEWRPDVILLDLLMPVMDGGAFRAIQRTRPDLHDIPVVALTAARHPIAQSTDLDVDAVLEKPFDLDELADVVRSVRPFRRGLTTIPPPSPVLSSVY